MLSFADAVGNLFNRLGRLGKLIREARAYQNNQLVNTTNTTTGVTAQFNGEPDVQALMGNAYISLLNSAGSSVGSTAQSIASSTVNRMIFRDNPRINQTLTSANVRASLREVIRQMEVAGASVLAMSIAMTPTTFAGTGNGIIVTSVRRPLDGLVLENTFGETLTATCTADSYLNGATAGNETITVTGTGSAGTFDFNFPLGSNSRASMSAIDGNVDNGSGNILTNSGFEDFTSNVPDNWTIVVGAAGTQIFDENTIVYDPVIGGSSLRITGDGSNLTQIRQQFDASAGTLGTLDPLAQYSLNLFLRRDGTAAAAGVLTVDLVDNNFNVINDANGTANSFTIDLTALTTVFASYTGVFRTPHILPSAQYIRYRLSTALTSGRSVYIDKTSMGAMTQLYTSGPFMAVHAGSIPFSQGDRATVAVTNSRGSGGSLDTFQTLFARLFTSDMIGGELLLPSSSTPTISDNLITS